MRRTLTSLLLLAGMNTVVHAQPAAQPPTTLPPTTPIPKVTPPTATPTQDVVSESPRIIETTSAVTPYRFWGSAEYLLWWMSNGDTPPLVTTGDPLDTVPGAIGQPGTRLLFGGNNALSNNGYSGVRLTFGAWINDSVGVEASGFAFETQSNRFAIASDQAGNPPIYVPIFFVNSPNGPREGSYTIADPNFFGLGIPFFGNLAIASSTKLWGTEVNAIAKVGGSGNFTASALIGYRYLSLDDSLALQGFTNSPAGVGFDFFQSFRESFATQNAFHGVNLGGSAKWNSGRLSVDAAAKVALGWTQQVVNVGGTTTLAGTGALANGTFNNQGALFVFPSNAGRQTGSDFTVVPQLTIKAGVNLTNNIKATVGYDFLYWSSVLRAGDQIDRRINDSQSVNVNGTLIGDALPAPRFDRTGFFAHGLNFGMEFLY